MSEELKIEGNLGGLVSLRDCFFKMISCKGHKLSFEIGGYIHSISNSINLFNQELDEGRKSLALLDEKGNPESYVYDKIDASFCEKWDKQTPIEEGQYTSIKIDPEKQEDAFVFEEKINKQKIKVCLKSALNMSKIEELSKSGVFQGVDLSPLFFFFT